MPWTKLSRSASGRGSATPATVSASLTIVKVPVEPSYITSNVVPPIVTATGVVTSVSSGKLIPPIVTSSASPFRTFAGSTTIVNVCKSPSPNSSVSPSPESATLTGVPLLPWNVSLWSRSVSAPVATEFRSITGGWSSRKFRSLAPTTASEPSAATLSLLSARLKLVSAGSRSSSLTSHVTRLSTASTPSSNPSPSLSAIALMSASVKP